MIARVALAACLVGGCARSIAGGEDVDAGVDGGATGVVCEAAAEDCEHGWFFGDCGGSGGPTLACGAYGWCRWFVGGCPAGWQASDCPPDDMCCHATPDGAWPFADWEPDSGMVKTEMLFDLAAIEGLVTATSPAEVAVHVDPSVAAPSAPRVVCSPDTDLDICEGGDAAYVRVSTRPFELSSPITFTIGSVVGEWLIVEIVPQPDGTLIGRAFVREFTDTLAPDLRTRCPPSRRVSMSGALTIDRYPFSITGTDTVHGTLDLALTTGHTVSLAF